MILADFQNLLPGEVLHNLLADFSIIESNKQPPFNSNNINWLLGLFYTGYMLYNYDEISVLHTEYISTLLDLDFNFLKSFFNKLFVALRDGIQASRARCHLKENKT